MSAYTVAEEVLSSLPAYVVRPQKDLWSRKQAEFEIAFWMSRAAIMATELRKLSPANLEYQSWLDAAPSEGEKK